MSIMLVCYSSEKVTDLNVKLDILRENTPKFFLKNHTLQAAVEPSEVGKNIAATLGMIAVSRFYIFINKILSNQIGEIAIKIYRDIGENNVLVLFEGERLIFPSGIISDIVV